VYITGDPQKTYFSQNFKSVQGKYHKYVIDNNSGQDVTYGSTVRVTIPAKGDILTSLFVKVIVPRNYISFMGVYALIEYCDLFIGGQLIERVTTDHTQFFNFRNMTLEDQDSTFTSATTFSKTQTVNETSPINQLIWEIPFYFYRKDHLGIPLCALAKHKVELVIKVREWSRLKEQITADIVTSVNTDGSFNYSTNYPVSTKNNPSDEAAHPLILLSVPFEYVVVPDEVRSKIINSTMSYIILQNQLQTSHVPAFADTHVLKLNFINPVNTLSLSFRTKEQIENALYIGAYSTRLQLPFNDTGNTFYYQTVYKLVQKYGNALYYNYVDMTYSGSLLLFMNNYIHHLTGIRLDFNGETIIDPEDSGHFMFLYNVRNMTNKFRVSSSIGSTIVGADNINSIDPLFYSYTFAENSYDDNPGGQVNFSRIREKLLTINLVPATSDRVLHVYARSNNILKIKDGMGGLMFTSASDFNLNMDNMSSAVY
jgi:hypothetical protein